MNARIRKKQLKKLNKVYFSDREVWDMRTTLAKYILAGLKSFRKLNKHSYPGILCGVDAGAQSHKVLPNGKDIYGAEEMEKWNELLDQFIYAFNEIVEDHPSNPYNIAFDKWYDQQVKDNKPLFNFKKNPDGTESNILDTENGFQFTSELLAQNKEYHKDLKEKMYLFIDYFEDLWD